MKTIDLEKYKSAWKKDASLAGMTKTNEEILSFLGRRSKGIGNQFKSALLFDIVFKSLLGSSAIVLIILFRNQSYPMFLSVLMMSLAIAGILFQFFLLRKIPGIERNEISVRESIQAKIDFYNTHFLKALFVIALSSTLLFVNGSMYYFYFEYGEVRAFELDDFLVFGGFILLSFIVSAYAQIRQFNYHIRQLENCLDEMNNGTIEQISIDDIKRKRKKNIIIFSLTFLLGLLVLLYFVLR